MYHLRYLLAIVSLTIVFSDSVYGSENVTITDVPIDTLVNLTGNNELWTLLLKDCEKPTLTCVQNNIYKYLKTILDETEDLQFTSFMKFTKNKLDYAQIEKSFHLDGNDTFDDREEEFPIESMSRSLQDNTAKFLMTHDLEFSLPDTLFPNSVLKISPRMLESSGTLVNLEVVSKDLDPLNGGVENGSRTFKKIRKFINEKIIYAILALLLIVKLLAVKFLFLLPLLVGAATAKKLLLKILLFVFPFLHHIFKFCAYYPIQAKYHHHKHLISHIHQVAPHKHHDYHGHHEGVEVIGPHAYGPPPVEHHGYHDDYFTDFGDEVSVVPDDGSGFPHGLISHRKDPTRDDNEISSYGHGPPARRKPNRPLTSAEIERMIAKAEKEAMIKARLERERVRIREENLRLQEQLNQAIKLQEKLKHQATYLNKKIPATKISSSVPYSKPGGTVNPPPLKGSPFDIGTSTIFGAGIDLPEGYIIPQHTVTQRPVHTHQVQNHQMEQSYPKFEQNHFEQQYQASLQHSYDQDSQSSQVSIQQQSIVPKAGPVYKPQLSHRADIHKQPSIPSATVDIQKSVEYDPRNKVLESTKKGHTSSNQLVEYNSGPVESFEVSRPRPMEKSNTDAKPKIEQEIYEAASITYDKFYSPILEKIDRILQGLGFVDEPCKERLICSMYKNPTTFSPHSNLLSAELSRDSSELQKPASTNSVVIRFYKYVQAARDGQDQRDCLRLYPSCPVNTEVS